jgi:hypothetical protein
MPEVKWNIAAVSASSESGHRTHAAVIHAVLTTAPSALEPSPLDDCGKGHP